MCLFFFPPQVLCVSNMSVFPQYNEGKSKTSVQHMTEHSSCIIQWIYSGAGMIQEQKRPAELWENERETKDQSGA